MRSVIIVVGIVLAAVGGATAYRALFLEPAAGVVIRSSGEVSEVPNYAKVVGGSVLFVFGAGIAFITATRNRAR